MGNRVEITLYTIVFIDKLTPFECASLRQTINNPKPPQKTSLQALKICLLKIIPLLFGCPIKSKLITVCLLILGMMAFFAHAPFVMLTFVNLLLSPKLRMPEKG